MSIGFLQNPKLLLLVIFLGFYVTGILIALFRVQEINIVLNLLHEYLYSIAEDYSSYTTIDALAQQSPTYQNALLNVLEKYPTIQKYEPYYIAPMEYGQSNKENYMAAVDHYHYLLMKRNYLNQDLKTALNPLTAIKNIFSFPSAFIKWIGFSPKETTSKLFNLFSWLIVFLLNLYGDEIKALIKLLFQHLFHT
jgi:hypothetical protein